MKKLNKVDDFTAEHMKLYGDLLSSSLPKGVGFGLVLFDGGEGLREFRYISNCPREDMFNALQAMVAKWNQESQNPQP